MTFDAVVPLFVLLPARKFKGILYSGGKILPLQDEGRSELFLGPVFRARIEFICGSGTRGDRLARLSRWLYRAGTSSRSFESRSALKEATA